MKSDPPTTTVPPRPKSPRPLLLRRGSLAFVLCILLALLASMTRKNRHNTATSFSSTSPTTTVSLPADAVPDPATLADGKPLPKLIVFDLDYTLWPFWVDTHVAAPLRASADGGRSVRDAHGASHGFYSDVAGILAALRAKGIQIGVASRTHAPSLAHDMLTALRLPSSTSSDAGEDGASSWPPALSVFDYVETFPGSKTKHFERIHKKSGVSYEEMLFFDDEARNRNVEDLGVVMQLVRDGVTREEVDRGIESWRKRNGRVDK